MSKLKEALNLKTNKEIYEFATKQKTKDLVNLIFDLPADKVKLACQLTFAYCDNCARLEEEKLLGGFIYLLSFKMKSQKKFRKEINGVLNFLMMSEEEKRQMITKEEKQKIREIQEKIDKELGDK